MVEPVQTPSSLCRPFASGRTHHKLNATVEAIAGELSERRQNSHQRIGGHAIQSVFKLRVATKRKQVGHEQQIHVQHLVAAGRVERIRRQAVERAVGIVGVELSFDE